MQAMDASVEGPCGFAPDVGAISTFAAEIESLVKQLETEFQHRRNVTAETASQLRDLRQRAERLFEDA